MQFKNLPISAILNPTYCVLIAKKKHNTTEQNIVALKTVSLNSPVVS